MTLREYLKKFNLSENDTVSIDVGYEEITDIRGTEVLESFREYLDYDVNSVYVYSYGDSIDVVFELGVQYNHNAGLLECLDFHFSRQRPGLQKTWTQGFLYTQKCQTKALLSILRRLFTKEKQ